MLDTLIRSLQILRHPAALRLIFFTAVVAFAVILALTAVIGITLQQVTFFENSWLEGILDIGGTLAAFVLSWFLFPLISPLLFGLCLERVVSLAEETHYPHLPPPREVPLWEGICSAAALAGLMLLLNLLLLPFLLVPVIGLLPYYLVNGYLLGREYFELVALRRMTGPEMKALRKRQGLLILQGGVMMLLLFTIPFVNLIAPVLAASFMAHLFHRHNSPRLSSSGDRLPHGPIKN